MIWRIAGLLIALAVVYAASQAAWRGLNPRAAPVADAPMRAPVPPVLPASAAPRPAVPPMSEPSPRCASAAAFADAAVMNAVSLQTAAWSVMGRAETGWEIYAPHVADEIATTCAPTDPGFAQALASWQGAHGLAADGIMDPATLKAMTLIWLKRRPFVAASAHGVCPAPPLPAALAWAAPAEGYLGKPIQLRAGALAAYRRMVAAARQDVPAMAGDKRLLTIFSGYRDPLDDAARCARNGDCGTIAKASCSAHRTGLAMDVYLGAAPGFVPESSADANRLFQSRTALYRWMVRNAARFGFVNYPFEPWHWEWTGEAP
jgi:hypothetical protein